MKQTEIGMIPDDWEVKEIKDFADVTTGNKNTQDAQENGRYPFYVRSPIVERINSYSYDSEGLVTAGDGVGTGKVFHFVKGKFGLHQRAYLVHKFQNVDSKYFYYIFSNNFYERVHSMTAKSSVDSVRREMITKMLIPLPPTLAEQQKIAKVLSDVDNVISTLEKLITKKKNLKQGTMQQLLTGKKHLPGFAKSTKFKQTEIGEIPEDWEVKELGEVAKNFTGLTFSPDDVCDYGTLVLRSSNIQNDMLSFNDNVYVNMNIPERAIAHKGDILICVRNGSKRLIGKSALITDSADKCAFGAFMTVLRTELLNQQFLFYVWQSDLIQKQIEESMGATINQITNKDIKHFLVTYPKLAAEQIAIANVLSSMDKEIEALNTKLEKYRDLKTGMMQQLLTGKIRLG